MESLQQQKKINPLQIPSMRVLKNNEEPENKAAEQYETDFILHPELREIGRIVSVYYNLTLDSMRQRTRKRSIIVARQVAMTLSFQKTDYSLSRIGSFFGGFDHATVIHSRKAISDLYETDRRFRGEVDHLEKKVDAVFEAMKDNTFRYRIDHEERHIEVRTGADWTYNEFLQLAAELAREDIDQEYTISLY